MEPSEEFNWNEVYSDLDGDEFDEQSEYETLAAALSTLWRWILSGGSPKNVQARVVAVCWINGRDFKATSLTALAESVGVQPTLAKRQSAEFTRVFGIRCERQGQYSDARRGADKARRNSKESFEKR